MYLKSIRIAGFKSFADPVTIELPRHICAVVGPNGCGKSNIVDAVLWVLGSLSSKTLRTDVMTDVIFSGSEKRKASAHASVELSVDNSSSYFGAKLASYDEISVRREISSQGDSNYYINGTACRRRDVVEMFMGTGLGASPYAVVRQGTITNIIEARPDEMRIFVEEAAGVSLYKERRRETENRIKRCNENLRRFNDLCGELDLRLTVLKKQGKKAELYKQVRQDLRQQNAWLQAIRWQNAKDSMATFDQQIATMESQQSRENASAKQCQQDSLKIEQQLTELNQKFNLIQSEYYETDNKLSQLQQQIILIQQRQDDWLATRSESAQRLWLLRIQMRDTRQEVRASQVKLKKLQPLLSKVNDAKASLLEQESTMQQEKQNWQQRWDDVAKSLDDKQHTYLNAQSEQESVKRSIVDSETLKEKLTEEIAQLEQLLNSDAVAELAKKIAKQQQSITNMNEACNTLEQELENSRNQENQSRVELEEYRNKQATMAEELAELRALQQTAALDTSIDDPKVSLFIDQLKPRKGWEQIAEILLGPWLKAHCVKDINQSVTS